MSTPDDESAFLAAMVAAGASPDGAAAVWRRGRQAWPKVAIDPVAFAERVMSSGAELAGVAIEDLFLAAGCLRGDSSALRELDRLLAPIRARLIRRGTDAALADDALQLVRIRLLLPIATQPSGASDPDAMRSSLGKLASYRGGGSLAAWLRVVVLRQVQTLLRASPGALETAIGDESIAADAPLAVLAHSHGPALRLMFRAAVAALDERLRQVLRMEIVEQLPHQEIADRMGTHRTTVVRWAEQARTDLHNDIRRRLMQELNLGAKSAESLLRALGGNLELSVGAALS